MEWAFHPEAKAEFITVDHVIKSFRLIGFCLGV